MGHHDLSVTIRTKGEAETHHPERDKDPVTWPWPSRPNYQCESHLLVNFSGDSTMLCLCPGSYPLLGASPPRSLTAVNSKTKGSFLGSGMQRSPQKAGVTFHLSRLGSVCAQPWATSRDTALSWCYGVSYTRPFWLSVMKTLCLKGSRGRKNDFHN